MVCSVKYQIFAGKYTKSRLFQNAVPVYKQIKSTSLSKFAHVFRLLIVLSVLLTSFLLCSKLVSRTIGARVEIISAVINGMLQLINPIILTLVEYVSRRFTLHPDHFQLKLKGNCLWKSNHKI